MAYRIAKEEGIRFPYLGNLRGHPFENTYCPRCGELLIERMGYSIIKAKIDETKRCPHCRESLPIKGEIKTLPQSS
jgi:pyruvate formate lyase activating enzyme